MLFLLMVLMAAAPTAEGAPAYGPELEGFEYAWPVQRFDFESQRQKLHMSYLEVRPEKPNGPELGHAPQIQDPKQFHAALLERLLR